MKRLYILILTLLVSVSSCKQFLEVDAPSTKIDVATAFASDAAAISLMTGIYVRAAQPSSSTFTSLSLSTSLSADELTGYGNSSSQNEMLYKNALNSGTFAYYWAEFYKYIYTANLIVERLNGINGVSANVKTRLEGEAKFIRAYFYFYLVNLYGDVPLVTTSTYSNNTTLSRTPVAEVYAQIIQDLKDAQTLLGADYTDADLITASTNRVRPNKWAAAAMLARAYLFTGDYANAITESTKVIDQSSVYTLEPLEKTFLSTSRETLFALQPVSINQNTYEGNTFILVTAPGYSNPVSLSKYVYQAFEPGDRRKSSWVGSFKGATNTYQYAYKYKVRSSGQSSVPISENEVILRLAEQYLIRAEAYIRTNRINLGVTDLNSLRNRAREQASSTLPNPLPALSASLTSSEALSAVEHERQVEMFTEFGDRWFTLKRMKGFNDPAISRADEVMPAVAIEKGSVWNTNWQLYPIPLNELKMNLNLIQNKGYN